MLRSRRQLSAGEATQNEMLFWGKIGAYHFWQAPSRCVSDCSFFLALYLAIGQWAVGGGAADLVNASLRLSLTLWQLLAAFRLGFAVAVAVPSLCFFIRFFGHFDALPGGSGLN